MFERLVDDIAAASAEHAAATWPDPIDREGMLRFAYDLVVSSLIAYRDLQALRRESPAAGRPTTGERPTMCRPTSPSRRPGTRAGPVNSRGRRR